MDMQIIWCLIFPVHSYWDHSLLPTCECSLFLLEELLVWWCLGPHHWGQPTSNSSPGQWMLFCGFHVIHSAKCGQLEWMGVRNWCALTTCSQGGDFHLWASIQALGNTHRIIRQQKQPGKMKPSHFLYDRTTSQQALWNKEDFHSGSM